MSKKMTGMLIAVLIVCFAIPMVAYGMESIKYSYSDEELYELANENVYINNENIVVCPADNDTVLFDVKSDNVQAVHNNFIEVTRKISERDYEKYLYGYLIIYDEDSNTKGSGSISQNDSGLFGGKIATATVSVNYNTATFDTLTCYKPYSVSGRATRIDNGLTISKYVLSYKRQGWGYTSGGVQTYLPYYENHSDYTNVMTNHTLNTGESYYVRTDNTSNFAGVFTAQVKNSGGTLLGNLIVTARLGG